MTAKQITDIERCACTMLSKEYGALYDTEVRSWIESILADPNYMELCPNGKDTDDRGREYTGPDFDRLEEQYGATDIVYARWMHDAIIRFGNNIVLYRMDNRPSGDTQHNVENIVVIVTSLAAQIVEFHQSVIDAWAMKIEEMRMSGK